MNSFIDDRGYIRIYLPEHPANNRGYILEHRYVVEQALGRYLAPQETVHHINEIKTDNRIGNLYLCSPEEHVAIHTRGIKRSAQENKKNRRAQKDKRMHHKLRKAN